MEKNRFRELIKSGKVIMGLYIFIPSEAVVDIIGWAGFDFVILDTEHASYDIRCMENLVRAAEARQMATVARIASPDPFLTQRVLDTGVDGVMFARINSRQDAENAVRFSRLAPMGERGTCPGMRAGRYHLMSRDEYNRRASETIVGVNIETKEGLEQAKEIISVPGIDYLRSGPNDLSASLGVSEDDPQVAGAWQHLSKLAKSAGVQFMMHADNPKEVLAALQKDNDLRLFFFYTDSCQFGKCLRGLVEETREIAAQFSKV
ncbi:HpcH/HpaI aldolase/citrate lyase family protein [Chloroflexota bacterium]